MTMHAIRGTAKTRKPRVDLENKFYCTGAKWLCQCAAYIVRNVRDIADAKNYTLGYSMECLQRIATFVFDSTRSIRGASKVIVHF